MPRPKSITIKKMTLPRSVFLIAALKRAYAESESMPKQFGGIKAVKIRSIYEDMPDRTRILSPRLRRDITSALFEARPDIMEQRNRGGGRSEQWNTYVRKPIVDPSKPRKREER